MSKRIVITGGGGFLGSHLTARLLAEGNHVICIDNFFTSSEQTVTPFLENPGYELIRHDIVDPVFVEDVDQIYNLACPAAPGHYQFNPVRTVKTSVLGAINMLGMARATGARIMQASTSEVYGDPEISPQVESYRGSVNPIGLRACYDEGKRAAETLFFDYHRQHGIEIRVARIFNTFGPNMHPFDGRVVSNFIRQALVGEDITIFGDGGQTRSFCYVSDLIDGFIRLMNADDFTGPVNLGNPVERTILDLADRIELIMPWSCRAGEIVNLVDVLNKNGVDDVMPDQLIARVLKKRCHRLLAAGEEVVDTNDVVALGKQSGRQVRAEKATPTCDHDSLRHYGHPCLEFEPRAGPPERASVSDPSARTLAPAPPLRASLSS